MFANRVPLGKNTILIFTQMLSVNNANQLNCSPINTYKNIYTSQKNTIIDNLSVIAWFIWL